MTELDPNSFANTNELITRELYMNLNADFARSVLKGMAKPLRSVYTSIRKMPVLLGTSSAKLSLQLLLR